MSERTRYEATVCVLLRRAGRWLLAVRGPDVSYAPGQIGLIGGHVEPVAGPDVLENTARREVAEEAGLDLTDVALSYQCSELYLGEHGQAVLTVTYVGELPEEELEPRLSAPEELSSLGWYSLDELSRAANCAPWVPPLIAAAEHSLDQRR